MARVIVGQQPVIEAVMAALFVGGHVLVEAVPGLGKTLLVRTLARALDVTFRRVQFTPDLMPADIIGTYVVMESHGQRKFEFQQGPVFANLLLADEINRATPKTQAALLEALEECAVTVANKTYELPDPFLALATQSPSDSEGTFPLPETLLDRFLLHVEMQSPSEDENRASWRSAYWRRRAPIMPRHRHPSSSTSAAAPVRAARGPWCWRVKRGLCLRAAATCAPMTCEHLPSRRWPIGWSFPLKVTRKRCVRRISSATCWRALRHEPLGW
jgi:MoxR-like ATPase